MAVKCPVCGSTRIRRGYRSTPFWSKMILRFNLLCDNCNWQFAGFALPWTIPSKTKSTRTKKLSELYEEQKVLATDDINLAAENQTEEKLLVDTSISENVEQTAVVPENTTESTFEKRKSAKKSKKKIKHTRLSES